MKRLRLCRVLHVQIAARAELGRFSEHSHVAFSAGLGTSRVSNKQATALLLNLGHTDRKSPNQLMVRALKMVARP